MTCRFVQVSTTWIVCAECGRGIRAPGVSASAMRPCQLSSLTATGKLLIAMPPPGDGVATIAKWTGMGHLAKIWEQMSGTPCGCGDRQQWLNAAWERFVWQHFSETS